MQHSSFPPTGPGNNRTTSCFYEYHMRPLRVWLTSLGMTASKLIHAVAFCPFYRYDDYYYSPFTEDEVQETIWEHPKSSLVIELTGLAGFYNSLEKSVLIHEPRPVRQLKSNFLCVVFPLGIFSRSFPFPTLPRSVIPNIFTTTTTTTLRTLTPCPLPPPQSTFTPSSWVRLARSGDCPARVQ